MRIIMNRLLSNILLLVIASVLIVLASAVVSYQSSAWHWFGRSGSILTIAGVLLSFRPLVRMGLDEWLKFQSTIDGGQLSPTPEELEADREAHCDGVASQIGFWMAIVGTLIWAYGDLLGGIPKSM